MFYYLYRSYELKEPPKQTPGRSHSPCRLYPSTPKLDRDPRYAVAPHQSRAASDWNRCYSSSHVEQLEAGPGPGGCTWQGPSKCHSRTGASPPSHRGGASRRLTRSKQARKARGRLTFRSKVIRKRRDVALERQVLLGEGKASARKYEWSG
ncbi:hypothetical protein BHE74_00056070 [Ensete ventricosum]|nr:hypothetical protein BHE74_00056070 [Ensete ventricosum]